MSIILSSMLRISLKYNKISLICCALISICDNKYLQNLELSYNISKDAIEYVGGLLRMIGLNENGMDIGAKSVVFQVPFDFDDDISPILQWKSNWTHYCSTGGSMVIQFISKREPFHPLIEVCGSNSCQLECRIYDTSKKIFKDRHSGYRMIPINTELSSKHIIIDNNLFVAIPTNNNQALIALHFNRFLTKAIEKPMITPRCSFPYGQVNFLQISSFTDKVYFIFTETASEMINYYNTFYDIVKPKMVFTRLGRICKEDQGVQVSELLFTSFIKATFLCQKRFSKQTVDYTNGVAASKSHGKLGNFWILFRSTQSIGDDSLFTSVFCPYNFVNIENQLEESKLAVLKETDSTKYWSLVMKRHNFSNCQNPFEHLSLNTEWMVAKHIQPSEDPLTMKINQSMGNPTTFDIVRSIPLTLILADNKTYSLEIDMIFVGTDNGVVAKNLVVDNKLIRQLKEKNIPTTSYNESTLRFDHSIQVFKGNITINNVKINIKTKSIIVVSNSILRRIPLEFCSNDCWSCNNNFDPMCQWSPEKKICEKNYPIKGRYIIRVYNCQSDHPFKSLNILKEKHEDAFWLIFSFVTFFCVFIVVLTISIAIRYSPGSFSRSSRTAMSSTIYQVIRNKDIEKPIRKPNNIHNSISSSISDSNSSRQRFRICLTKNSSRPFHSTKDSIVYENKFYLKTAKSKNPHHPSRSYTHKERNKFKAHFSTIYSKESSHLTSWKSCEAII